MSPEAVGGGAWLIAALVLGIAELVVPGVFLIFLAMAAAITGLASLALPELGAPAQLGAFAVWSILTVFIGRRWYRDYPVEAADPLLNSRAARLVGQVVEVEVAIQGSQGRVRVGDGSWPARGAPLPAGAQARIAAVADGVLLVEPPDDVGRSVP